MRRFLNTCESGERRCDPHRHIGGVHVPVRGEQHPPRTEEHQSREERPGACIQPQRGQGRGGIHQTLRGCRGAPDRMRPPPFEALRGCGGGRGGAGFAPSRFRRGIEAEGSRLLHTIRSGEIRTIAPLRGGDDRPCRRETDKEGRRGVQEAEVHLRRIRRGEEPVLPRRLRHARMHVARRRGCCDEGEGCCCDPPRTEELRLSDGVRLRQTCTAHPSVRIRSRIRDCTARTSMRTGRSAIPGS